MRRDPNWWSTMSSFSSSSSWSHIKYSNHNHSQQPSHPYTQQMSSSQWPVNSCYHHHTLYTPLHTTNDQWWPDNSCHHHHNGCHLRHTLWPVNSCHHHNTLWPVNSCHHHHTLWPVNSCHHHHTLYSFTCNESATVTSQQLSSSPHIVLFYM